ncbi:MAG TPA: hypothetical protein VIR98_02845 [Candidatus Paceibacterota bacterium]|jgi:hypothetical protein
MANKKGINPGAVAAGLIGITAAAVGAYYLYGSDEAKKNRAKVKAWMLKAKGDVLEELEKAQEVTESAYETALDTVARKYRELKEVDPDELATFLAEMKDHWQGIKKTMRGGPKKRTAAKKKKAE